MPEIRRSTRKLPPGKIREMKALARKIDNEEGPAIRAKAARHREQARSLADVFRQLQTERQRQGLSLAQLAERSGIDKARLSRLENAAHPNVTIDTIERYAAALAMKLVVSVVARSA